MLEQRPKSTVILMGVGEKKMGEFGLSPRLAASPGLLDTLGRGSNGPGPFSKNKCQKLKVGPNGKTQKVS